MLYFFKLRLPRIYLSLILTMTAVSPLVLANDFDNDELAIKMAEEFNSKIGATYLWGRMFGYFLRMAGSIAQYANPIEANHQHETETNPNATLVTTHPNPIDLSKKLNLAGAIVGLVGDGFQAAEGALNIELVNEHPNYFNTKDTYPFAVLAIARGGLNVIADTSYIGYFASLQQGSSEKKVEWLQYVGVTTKAVANTMGLIKNVRDVKKYPLGSTIQIGFIFATISRFPSITGAIVWLEATPEQQKHIILVASYLNFAGMFLFNVGGLIRQYIFHQQLYLKHRPTVIPLNP